MSIELSGPPADALGARVDRRLLHARAARVLRALGHSRSELSIALVDDDEMRELNGTWRAKPEPTDVLSFSLLDGDHESYRGRMLGDVVIGIETAARQARARHRALDDEVERLLVHGVLHLIGHDHVRDDEARRMRAEERRLRSVLRVAEA